jgi:hypothetical protein
MRAKLIDWSVLLSIVSPMRKDLLCLSFIIIFYYFLEFYYYFFKIIKIIISFEKFIITKSNNFLTILEKSKKILKKI